MTRKLRDRAKAKGLIKNGGFVVKDSGQRRMFSTGAVRDAAEGKGFFHLLPYIAIERMAQLYEAGARKYGKNNWRKGMPCSVFIDSMDRHALKLGDGWTDEDHAAAVLFNAAGFIWTEAEAMAGRLPAELLDLPQHQAWHRENRKRGKRASRRN